MKKLLLGTILVLLGLLPLSVAWAGETGHGVLDSGEGQGMPLYVAIEVNWDGSDQSGDWTVWGPKWDPQVGVGTPLTGCTDCLEMNYDFVFKGRTVQFEEVYVPTVVATPQSRNVVLHDRDGDGTYTGSLPAQRYELQPGYLYLDRIDYQVSFDEDRNLTDFRYIEYEHKKLLE